MKLSAETIVETLRKVDTRGNVPGSVNCQKCVGNFPFSSAVGEYREEVCYVESNFTYGVCLKKILVMLLSITDKSDWGTLLKKLEPLNGAKYMCIHQEYFDLINQAIDSVIYSAGMEIE